MSDLNLCFFEKNSLNQTRFLYVHMHNITLLSCNHFLVFASIVNTCFSLFCFFDMDACILVKLAAKSNFVEASRIAPEESEIRTRV